MVLFCPFYTYVQNGPGRVCVRVLLLVVHAEWEGEAESEGEGEVGSGREGKILLFSEITKKDPEATV